MSIEGGRGRGGEYNIRDNGFRGSDSWFPCGKPLRAYSKGFQENI